MENWDDLDKRMKSDIPMKCDIRKYLKYLKDRKKKNRIKNEECCKNKEYDTNNPSTKN
jgi:hypothetical protein